MVHDEDLHDPGFLGRVGQGQEVGRLDVLAQGHRLNEGGSEDRAQTGGRHLVHRAVLVHSEKKTSYSVFYLGETH